MNPQDTHAYHLSRRCRRVNRHALRRGRADYVLCWLQQTLRGENNPVIDAAIALGNRLRLPVVVYHGVGQHYPHASDRLHHYLLTASQSLEQAVTARGLRFLRVIEHPQRDVTGLVYQLCDRAAALVVDDLPVFVGRSQLERVASRLTIPVIAVDGASLVPESAIGTVCHTTVAFRQRVNSVRDAWLAEPMNVLTRCDRFTGELATTHDTICPRTSTVSHWIRRCDIDHSLPPVDWCRGERGAALAQLVWAAVEIIPRYAQRRNNPAVTGVSYLSPHLHFGVLGPHDVARLATDVVASRGTYKFLDELLVWREYSHHVTRHTAQPTHYTAVSAWARDTLAAHAQDAREHLYTLKELVHGLTHDETWNAAQRQFTLDGWMHNNLRMYWSKRLLSWTASPEDAWATAIYLNDRFSLDGRDPATYTNLRWSFGGGRPAKEIPVYGTVPRKSDAALRRRDGVPAWLVAQAERSVPAIAIPHTLPIHHRPQASGHVG